jgi:hypothetical protein
MFAKNRQRISPHITPYSRNNGSKLPEQTNRPPMLPGGGLISNYEPDQEPAANAIPQQ